MNSIRNMARPTFCAVLLGLLTVQPAHAYIDPGTGGMILQLLFGGIAGALVVIKLYWHRLMSIFRRETKSSQETTVEVGKDGDT